MTATETTSFSDLYAAKAAAQREYHEALKVEEFMKKDAAETRVRALKQGIDPNLSEWDRNLVIAVAIDSAIRSDAAKKHLQEKRNAYYVTCDAMEAFLRADTAA